MDYIQVVGSIVNLIGGAEVGLPLNESFLAGQKGVLNLPADRYEEVKIGDFYDAENDVFLREAPVTEPELVKPVIAPVTNEEVTQSVMYLTATQDIAAAHDTPIAATGFSMQSQSPRYDFWRFAYFRRHTNVFTLERLAAGGVLTRAEVGGIIADRLEEFGE